MKAIVRDEDGKQFECKITRKDSTKLIIEFINKDKGFFPYSILSNAGFNVQIKPTEDEIGCGDCNSCLTPIC